MAKEESELSIRQQRSIAWSNLKRAVNRLIELGHSPGIPGIGYDETEYEKLVKESGEAATFLKKTKSHG